MQCGVSRLHNNHKRFHGRGSALRTFAEKDALVLGDHLALLSNVARRQGIVASDHDALEIRAIELLHGRKRLGLEAVLHDEHSGHDQA